MADMDTHDTGDRAASGEDAGRAPDPSTSIDQLQAELESADPSVAPDIADELTSRLADELDADEERS